MEKKATILVVEDDVGMATTLKMLLEREGYSPVIAQDGQEALDMLGPDDPAHPGRSIQPDLILLDVILGRLDGYQVCERLRQREQASHIPVIMLTVRDSPEDRVRGLDCGADDYITKPFHNKELVARVRAMLRVKRLQDENQRALEALRASEAKFRVLAENTSAAVFIHQDMQYCYVNPATGAINGYTQEEMLGKSIEEFVHPDFQELVRERWQARERGEPVLPRDELRILTKNGEERWVDFTAGNIEFEGKPAVIGTAFDITERKRAEQALRESEAKFRVLAESTSAAVFIYQDMFIRYVNPAGEAITGYTQQEMLGMRYWELIHPDFQELVRERGQAREHGEPALPRYEVKLLTKNGEERWVDFTAGNIEFEGKPAVIGTALDITERKRAEHALRESEQSFRALAENANDGILVGVDKRGTHVYANKRTAEITGYSVAELLTMGMRDLAAPHEYDKLAERYGKRLEGEPGPRQDETEILRKDGEKVPVEATGARTMWQGQPADIVIIRDIAERKRKEEILRRHAYAQATLYAVTRTVATLLDPDELLYTALKVVLPVVDSDAGWVTFIDPALDKSPRIVAWHGIPQPFGLVEEAGPSRICPACADLLTGGDMQTEPRVMNECACLPAEVAAKANLHSHVDVPLKAGDKVLGILHIAWRASRPYSESDRTLLTAIGQQVGLGLHNAQLYQAARQVNYLKVLNELGGELATLLDPERVMEVALHHIAAVLDAPMGALVTLPPRSGPYLDKTYTLSQGWTEMVASEESVAQFQVFLSRLQSRREIMSFSADELAALSEKHDLAQDWGPHGIAAPIWVDDQLIAALALGGRSADNLFSEEDRALAQAAASCIGQAIQRARLYRTKEELLQQMEMRTRELDTLGQIARAVSSGLTLDKTLETIYQQTQQVMPVDAFFIALCDERTGQVTYPLVYSKGQRCEEPTIALSFMKDLDQVLDRGEPLLINRTPGNADAIVMTSETAMGNEDRPTASLLYAPLRIGSRLVGVMSVQSYRLNAYDQRDVMLLTGIANHAATAIENAQLYEETDSLRAFNEDIVQSMEEGILLEDETGHITFINPSTTDLLGHTSEELRGRHWTAIVAPEHIAQAKQEASQRTQGASSRYETMLLDKQGQQVPVIVSARPLFADGRFKGVLSVFTDITDRKRTERALSESEERFRSLFENAPFCIFEVDFTQVPPVILGANRWAEQVYGWPHEEFAASPLERIIPSEVRPDLERMVRALKSGQIVTLETVSQRRDSSTFPARISATPETASRLKHIIIAVEDLTAERVRRSEEEAIAEERRRIAREIHDGLAQDLASLRFRANLWHDLVDHDPAQMHAELKALRELLGEKIREVRRSIFALRPVELDELGFFPALHQFVDGFGQQNQLHVDMHISGPEDRLPSLLEPVLFRVIQEALNNVGKHARASTVWIELDSSTVNSMTLMVRDDGVGFDPTILHEAVQRGHVGLKQMRERVEELRGKFWLRSQAGGGTEIRIVLPLTE